MTIPENKRIRYEALSFDDVSIIPAYSEVHPKQVTTSTYLTRNIQLNIPQISAAMDTITESEMAISMALEGGMGIIHKNMSIADQSTQVRKVKRSQSGMILEPVTLGIESNIGEARRLMNLFNISGIPIVDGHDKLQGILTQRDLRFLQDDDIAVREVMTSRNLITAPSKIDLREAEGILTRHKIEKLPIVNKQGHLLGLITYKDILKNKDRPNACKDEHGRLRVGAAVGRDPQLLERVEALNKEGVDLVVLDSAHGHHRGIIQEIQKIKSNFPELQLVGGNVVTPDGAMALVEAGVDGVKVGVGPGSICTTRIVAGAGVPQFSAILQVAQALEPTGIPLIADGGIRFSGDMVKALAAGASAVMIGSMLAGTHEAPGKVILYEGRKFKSYRGMGSVEAMEEGSRERYFRDGDESGKLVPEGVVGRVPFKGLVQEILYQMTGGLRSGMGYCGAKSVKDLQKVHFVKVTHAGNIESHTHNIEITREPPNYSPR